MDLRQSSNQLNEAKSRGLEPTVNVVMINDCAYVGQTILKYLPSDIEKQYITRTRSLWDKTLGLTYKILKARGDIYHAHYLLQDCYIASRLRKHPLIGHAHGTDLREGLKHPLWRRVVLHNLKHCDRVLASTPDLSAIARAAGTEASYLPNPVDMEVFYPKPLVDHEGKMRVLIASSAWTAKGTDMALNALSQLKGKVEVSMIQYGPDYREMMSLAESRGLHVSALPKVPHEQTAEYYWNADLIVDQFRCGVVGNVFLEAVACGRPAIGYVSSEYPQFKTLPLKDVNSSDKIVETISSIASLGDVWRAQYEYVKMTHDASTIAQRTLKVYREVLDI